MLIKCVGEVLGKSELRFSSKISSSGEAMAVSTALSGVCATPVNDSLPTSWNPPTVILVEKSQEIDSVSRGG